MTLAMHGLEQRWRQSVLGHSGCLWASDIPAEILVNGPTGSTHPSLHEAASRHLVHPGIVVPQHSWLRAYAVPSRKGAFLSIGRRSPEIAPRERIEVRRWIVLGEWALRSRRRGQAIWPSLVQSILDCSTIRHCGRARVRRCDRPMRSGSNSVLQRVDQCRPGCIGIPFMPGSVWHCTLEAAGEVRTVGVASWAARPPRTAPVQAASL